MISLNLGLHREVRVWLNELPELSYPIADVVERSIRTKAPVAATVRRAAVEMLIPTGGFAQYGLLGAEFVSGASGELRLQVAVSDNGGQRIDWSLASGIDEVRAGLPQEYAESMLDGALTADEVHGLGSGVLRFQHAAYAVVGSSPWIFQHLAVLVVRLLASELNSRSERELAALLEYSR